MDLPPYIFTENQQNYQEELNQTLRDNLSNNGYPLPSIKNVDLTVTPVLNPATGTMTTLAALMPDGTLWYVVDAVPAPTPVIKISGVLKQFTTTAYP